MHVIKAQLDEDDTESKYFIQKHLFYDESFKKNLSPLCSPSPLNTFEFRLTTRNVLELTSYFHIFACVEVIKIMAWNYAIFKKFDNSDKLLGNLIFGDQQNFVC